MSISNDVSLTLTPDQEASVFAAIDALAEVLSFTISLTPAERMRRVKAGAASELFITQALNLAQQNPEIIPRGMSIEEMQKDMALRAFLQKVRARLATVSQRVDDTHAVCGTEALQAGLVIYRSAKTFGQGLGIDAQVEELSQRFKKSKADAAPAEGAPEAISA